MCGNHVQKIYGSRCCLSRPNLFKPSHTLPVQAQESIAQRRPEVAQARGRALLNLRLRDAEGGLLGRTLLALVSNKVTHLHCHCSSFTCCRSCHGHILAGPRAQLICSIELSSVMKIAADTGFPFDPCRVVGQSASPFQLTRCRRMMSWSCARPKAMPPYPPLPAVLCTGWLLR